MTGLRTAITGFAAGMPVNEKLPAAARGGFDSDPTVSAS
jgi:hypothetical protein